MYCELIPIAAPELASVLKRVHDPSGVGVLPVRTLITRLVAAVVSAFQVAVSQFTVWPASNTRDLKAHGVAYGLSLSQSRDTLPPPTLRSLTSGRNAVPMPIGCEITWMPSMK